MYWIYLILFTFIVFVPNIVHHITLGMMGFSINQTEEFLIFIFGSLGFAIFLYQEKKLKKNKQEKIKIQSQINQMTKDLTNSYSYIGEINRKLDILEHIAYEFPESSHPSTKKRKEAFDYIIEAVQLLGKSKDFSIRFLCYGSNELLKEIKSNTEVVINYPKARYDDQARFIQDEEYIVAKSPKKIDGVYACIIMRKKNSQHSIDDPEIMKTLAFQALFLFIFTYNSELRCKS